MLRRQSWQTEKDRECSAEKTPADPVGITCVSQEMTGREEEQKEKKGEEDSEETRGTKHG